jgi:hypothetical protein
MIKLIKGFNRWYLNQKDQANPIIMVQTTDQPIFLLRATTDSKASLLILSNEVCR